MNHFQMKTIFQYHLSPAKMMKNGQLVSKLESR